MKTRLSSHGYWRTLVLLFILTLPFVNPWVRGDGVEYYAYVRTLIIDGNLSFENEWQASNPTFKMTHLDAEGRVLPQEYTRSSSYPITSERTFRRTVSRGPTLCPWPSSPVCMAS